MAQNIDVRIRAHHSFVLPFGYDLQHRTHGLFQEVVRVRLDKTLAHPHLEHEESAILRAHREEIKKVPHEFSNLVEGSRNPLEVQFELSAKFFGLLHRDREEEILFVLEVLINTAVGDTRPLSYF